MPASVLTGPGTSYRDRRRQRTGSVARSLRRIDPDTRLVLTGAGIAFVIVAGMALGVAPLTLVGIALGLGVSLFAPDVGLVVLAVVAPLRAPLVIPAPGLLTLLVGAILVGCLGRLSSQRQRLSVGLPLAFAGAFWLYVFAQQSPEMLQLWPGDQGYRTVSLFIQLSTLLGAAVATALVVRRRSVYPFITALLMGAAAAAALAVASYVAPSLPFVANLVNEMQVAARVIGPFLDPNYFGTYLATAAVLAIAVWPAVGSRTRRVLLIVLVGLLLITLAMTLSRGGFLALIVGVFVLAMTKGRKWAIATVTVALLGGALLYPLFLEFRVSEVQGSTSLTAFADQAASDDSRVYAATAGLDLFASSPIFGIGLGQYKDATVRIAHTPHPIESHNWYMNVLAEQGLVGIILWLGLLVAVARGLWARVGLPRQVGVGVLGAVAAGCISLQTPTSFQTSALPVIAVTAALVGLWPTLRTSVARGRVGP